MSTYKARKNAIRYSKSLLATSALTAAGIMALSGPALADNWTDHQAIGGGSIDIDTSVANTTNITQHGHMVKVQGDGDINAGWTVNVAQPSSSAKYVLYDIEGDASVIAGTLNANGEIYIFDPNGTIFTKDSQVNVGAIVTSTGFISDENLAANRRVFEGVNTGGAINIEEGATINVSQAGLAAFVAPTVRNSGIINAKAGSVVLASGEQVTLDMYGDGLFEVAVEGELANAIVENKGVIAAEGGTVTMSALAAKGAVDNVVNNEGVITVGSATQSGGKIVLAAGNGTATVSGVLDASGMDGGSVEVTGDKVHVTQTAEISVDGGRGADQEGDGGTANIYGTQYAVLEGRVSGRGGANGGDGGNVELSAGDSVGFSGLVDLGAANGNVGTFVIDPAHLFINDTYSFLGFGIGPIDTLTVYDQAIANSLANSDVKLWATETLNTGSNIDISEYDYDVQTSPAYFDTSGPIWTWHWVPAVYTNYNGITSNTLTVAAPEVNLVHDITLGNGALNVADILSTDSVLGLGLITPWTDIIVDHLNLDGKVYKRTALGNASFATLADDAQINTTAGTINVLSNAALIQQAVQFADAADGDQETINVADGNYTENVAIDRSVLLQSENGREATTITGIAGVNALGTVVFKPNTDGVQLGNTDKGFTIVGIDNGAPGLENAAVYLQGNQSNHTIKGNEIVANGEAGLLSEYGATVSNILIDGNIFSGQTFQGANPASVGFGSQFSTPNVPRQLVTMGGGTGGGNTSNITFTNNEITGTAGGISTDDGVSEQGNTLVTIDADNSEITNNIFHGTTTRYGTSLRARGDGTLISGNTFYAEGLSDTAGHIYVRDNVYTGLDGIQDDIIDIWNTNTFIGRATVSSNDTSATEDFIGVTIQGAIDFSQAGATVFVNGATYTENLTINKALKLMGLPGATVNAATSDALVTVTAAGVNIDPFVFDGLDLAEYGILATNADNLIVDGNTFQNFTKDGIRVVNSDDITITGNTVTGTGLNGIAIVDSARAKVINGNTISDTGRAGVTLNGSVDGLIDDNTIFDVGGAGVWVNNSARATISDNTITTTWLSGNASQAASGVHVLGSNKTVVDGNIITDAAKDGVYVADSSEVRVKNNEITGGLTGVSGDNAGDLHVFDNDIEDAAEYGIKITNSPGNTYAGGAAGDVDVWGNFIFFGNDTATGIYASNSAYISVGPHLNPFADGLSGGNTIYGGGTGIHVTGSDNAMIRYNTVGDVANDGIYVDYAASVTIRDNDVNSAGEDGIETYFVGNIDILSNTVRYVGDNGIYATNFTNAEVHDNIVNNAGLIDGGAGIYLDGYNDTDSGTSTTGYYANVTGNTVNSIYGTGINVGYTDEIYVAENTVQDVLGDGITTYNAGNIDINNNLVERTAGHGISASGSGYASITENTVNDAGYYSEMTSYYGYYGYYGADGIHVENVAGYNDGRNVEVDGEGHYVEILNNDINRSEANGIYVANSGSAKISENTIIDSGIDGIHVENIGGEGYYGDYGPPVVVAYSLLEEAPVEEGGYYGGGEGGPHYGLVITHNTITNAGDDGIDVDGVEGRAKVAHNDITNVGYNPDTFSGSESYYGSYSYEYGYYGSLGGDGIRIANVSGNYDGSPAIELSYNVINRTGDDGIEVVDSSSVLIEGNTITNAGSNDGVDVQNYYGYEQSGGGYSGSSQYYGSYYSQGADAIHVENVYGYDGTDYAVQIEGNTIGVREDEEVEGVMGAGDDGIEVVGSGRTRIADNTISNVGDNPDFYYGVYNSSSYNDYGYYGSYYSSSNQYSNGGDGIAVYGGMRGRPDVMRSLLVQEAPVEIVSYYGGANIEIVGNDIENAADDGIDVVSVGGPVLIDSNTIHYVGYSPDYSQSYNSSNSYNYYSPYTNNSSGSSNYSSNGGDGIHVENVGSYYGDSTRVALVSEVGPSEGVPYYGYGYNTIITNNVIDEVGDDGIEVLNAPDVLIADNTITNFGLGMADYSYYSSGYSNYYGSSYGSEYSSNGGDGIYVDYAYDTQGQYYDYAYSYGDNTVSVIYTNGFADQGAVDIFGNTIDNTGDDGIEVVYSGVTNIDGNTITNVGRPGYYGSGDYHSSYEYGYDNYYGGYYGGYYGNYYSYSYSGTNGADAIHVNHVRSQGYENTTTNVYEYVDGYWGGYLGTYYGYSNDDNNGLAVSITNNTIDTVVDDGIQVLNSGDTLIDGNTISNIGVEGFGDYGYYGGSVDEYGADGIHVASNSYYGGYYGGPKEKVLQISIYEEESDTPLTVQISNNEITNVADDGIEATDIDNLIVTDNDITNIGDIGILANGYYNGSVVLAGNTVTDARVGARFESGEIDISNLSNPNSFINTVSGATPIGLEFDQIGEDNNSLTIADRTLGGTIFSGFQQLGSYYVYFTDGSILEPISNSVIVINGLNANFDGIVPASTGGILTQTQLDFIEARLHDADDAAVNGRGQIFVGLVPGPLNVEDFFNQFGNFNPGTSGLNLTITGLPRVTPFGLNLNSITPFAGGEANPADIEPAAGDDGSQAPQDIEPAAGGEEVACWGQALNAAVTGVVNYNFSSSPEEALNDATACGGGAI